MEKQVNESIKKSQIEANHRESLEDRKRNRTCHKISHKMLQEGIGDTLHPLINYRRNIFPKDFVSPMILGNLKGELE